jgi:hypothetical protein
VSQRKSNVLAFPEPKSPIPKRGKAYSYEVEDDVPPPPPPRQASRRYPFTTMKVGQSFSFLIGDWNKIMTAAGYMRRRHGMKFVSRKISDTKGRIWRME